MITQIGFLYADKISGICFNEERNILQDLAANGQPQHRIKHAKILLRLDEMIGNQERTYEKIEKSYHIYHISSVI